MKKVITIVFILFSISCFSQVKYNRLLATDVLEAIFPSEGNETFNAYNKGEDLDMDIEFKVPQKYETIEGSASYPLLELMKDIIYRRVSKISEAKIYDTILYDCNYDFIVFNMRIITEDYHTIPVTYFIHLSKLREMGDDLNKKDFYSELRKMN